MVLQLEAAQILPRLKVGDGVPWSKPEPLIHSEPSVFTMLMFIDAFHILFSVFVVAL